VKPLSNTICVNQGDLNDAEYMSLGCLFCYDYRRRLTLPKVSGGGLTTGKTQDYHIDLKEGSYVYSCPLNPTPDYPIVVKP
jgi:hypothetical protein